MSAPLVSICIPAYNAEDYVAEALDSALAQTWSPLEIVVVNDGSTDGTARILDRYAERDDRIRVIHQENQGQCAAANHAFRASDGELIKFFDADDLLSPEYVEKQVARLDGRRDCIASAEWARFYDDLSEASFTPRPVWQDMDPVDWLVMAWQDARPMMQCALWLIPRRILDASGLWDERLSLINDFEFFARVLVHAEQILFTPGARLYYRSGMADSLSQRTSRPAVESAFLSLMLGTQHLLDAEDSPRTREAAANMLQDFVYAYYPHHDDLRERVKARIDDLGGSSLPPDGPPGFQLLRRITGWKVARRIEQFAVEHGLNRASLLDSETPDV